MPTITGERKEVVASGRVGNIMNALNTDFEVVDQASPRIAPIR
jgi:hypothetical protein